MAIMYQIINQLTGKKLYTSYRGESSWGDCGAYWRKPDTVKGKLTHLLHDYDLQVVVNPYGTYKDRVKGRYRSELAPHIKVLATEMQTIGATRSIPCENFIKVKA